MPGKTSNTNNTTFNWFDIFKVGTHTDSKGATAEFTEQDLQSVVTNFSAKKSPLVIGHPKVDDPAWGWTSDLKIEDGVLFARAEDVSAEFAQAVADKRYPNRSVRLNKTDNGYELGHIGFLGGKPPAVDGLAWQFNDDSNGVEFEFNASEKIESISLQTSNVVTRLLGNLHTFITDKFGTETANQVVPEWDGEYLKEDTIIAQHERRQERQTTTNETEFSTQPDHEDNAVTEEERKALQASLDAERTKNKQLEFQARLSRAHTFVNEEVNGGKSPRLTNTDGVAEFMAHISESDDTNTFEFSAEDGEQSISPEAWFQGFLKGLPEQGALTKDFSKDNEDGEELDASTLATKASEFQKAQADKGITISLSDAISKINQENS